MVAAARAADDAAGESSRHERDDGVLGAAHTHLGGFIAFV
jgi:hypothetical protein